jgi:D-alanyl-D-alanine carboxypeptidase/D-alanyl-D-alanine-endopeptidase (penicillin-binding protein 4)
MTISCTRTLCVLAIIPIALAVFLSSCSTQGKITRAARQDLFSTSALKSAHVGVSIYEPASSRYLFNYQGDKYFVPASNTKIPTCYAAMKYLGDSLTGILIGTPDQTGRKSNRLVIVPAGDPTFLHPDFRRQPVFDFLKTAAKTMQLLFAIDTSNIERWGSGWSWNDYEEYYMAERSAMPIFGNTITVRLAHDEAGGAKTGKYYFTSGISYFDKLLSRMPVPDGLLSDNDTVHHLSLGRSLSENSFIARQADQAFSPTTITFVTRGCQTAIEAIADTLASPVVAAALENNGSLRPATNSSASMTVTSWRPIHSQPTDSLLSPMMHHSDNFFAEQSLLMVSRERLGVMDDSKIIDLLLHSDFKDLPQAPRWVDGSGLSRYNLFTPQDFVMILEKMRADFGIERIKTILPTGGTGTLGSYYKADSNLIFAKTGTLSGVVALSGFLYTRHNKLLVFSVLVNNHRGSATEVRRAVEKFIRRVRRRY